MPHNSYYEALLEGRFSLAIESEQDPADADVYVASYTNYDGTRIEAKSTSQADAHNQCVELVREAIRDGSLTPSR